MTAKPWPPAGLAKPAHRALAAAGITNLGDLATRTEAEIAALHGMRRAGLPFDGRGGLGQAAAEADPASTSPTASSRAALMAWSSLSGLIGFSTTLCMPVDR